jgi:hypothetical protein
MFQFQKYTSCLLIYEILLKGMSEISNPIINQASEMELCPSQPFSSFILTLP